MRISIRGFALILKNFPYIIVSIFIETRKIFTIYRYQLLKFFIFSAPFIFLIYLPSWTNIKII